MIPLGSDLKPSHDAMGGVLMQTAFRPGVYAALAVAGLIGTWCFDLQLLAGAGARS